MQVGKNEISLICQVIIVLQLQEYSSLKGSGLNLVLLQDQTQQVLIDFCSDLASPISRCAEFFGVQV